MVFELEEFANNWLLTRTNLIVYKQSLIIHPLNSCFMKYIIEQSDIRPRFGFVLINLLL